MATIYAAPASRGYNSVFLAVSLVLLGLVICGRHILPAFFLVPAIAFLIFGSVMTILALVTKGAGIEVTDEGILYRSRLFPLIEFNDIVEIRLLPRRRTLSDKSVQDALREEWRPVIIRLRDFKKYSSRMPLGLGIGLRDPDDPQLARLTISFHGLAGDAREFYQVVLDQLEKSGH